MYREPERGREEKDPTRKGLELAYKILRGEASPNAETCTNLLIIRQGMGEGRNDTTADREIKTTFDRAISACRNDIHRIEQLKLDAERKKRELNLKTRKI